MKKCLIFLLTAVLLLMLVCCGEKEEPADTPAAKQPLNSPAQTTGGNIISDPVTNSNKESAYVDAVNAASQLMSYMAEEGVAYIEDGTVFAVEKNGKTSCCKYNPGSLDYAESVTLGNEITPKSDISSGWLPNVRVFATP